jgi:hypothetical protein
MLLELEDKQKQRKELPDSKNLKKQKLEYFIFKILRAIILKIFLKLDTIKPKKRKPDFGNKQNLKETSSQVKYAYNYRNY